MGLFLRDWLPTAKPRDILHFAPEPSIRPLLSRLPGVDYIGADLDPKPGDLELDITAIPFDAESFDLVVCAHVLEHVPDDELAIRELRRVLRPGGTALLQHPIVYTIDATYEDPSVIDPDQRAIHFGQRDHVRLYGRDLGDRLRSAGFAVEVTSYADLDPELRGRYRLEEPWAPDASGADIYRCRPAPAP
jgi:SAM-dependent methyltransferase